MTAECLPYREVRGTCDRCGTPLPPRRRRWCGEVCRDDYWQNHDWGAAREAALRRDGWTCQRCGHIGWADVPSSVLRIEHHHRVTGSPAVREDWALALGLISEHESHAEPWDDRGAAQRRANALEQLPDSVRELQSAERRPSMRSGRVRARCGHDLEVNHVNPRKGRGYAAGCHNHLDNLETLCRACHTEETARQTRERKPERDAAWQDGYGRARAGEQTPPTIQRGGGYHPDSLQRRYEGRRELIEAWLRGWRKGLQEYRECEGQLSLEESE